MWYYHGYRLFSPSPAVSVGSDRDKSEGARFPDLQILGLLKIAYHIFCQNQLFHPKPPLASALNVGSKGMQIPSLPIGNFLPTSYCYHH